MEKRTRRKESSMITARLSPSSVHIDRPAASKRNPEITGLPRETNCFPITLPISRARCPIRPKSWQRSRPLMKKTCSPEYRGIVARCFVVTRNEARREIDTRRNMSRQVAKLLFFPSPPPSPTSAAASNSVGTERRESQRNNNSR